MNTLNNNLSALRVILSDKETDAYIIPSTDPHLDEYVPDHWRIIEWLTGFKGSNAIVVITETFAGLWTDSRYFIQAQAQLQDSGFELIKPVGGGMNDYTDWLAENIAEGSKIALDGRTMSIERMRKIKKALEAKNVSFCLESDYISNLWT